MRGQPIGCSLFLLGMNSATYDQHVTSRANLWRTLIFVAFVGPGPVIGLLPWMFSHWRLQTPIASWRYAGLLLIVAGFLPLADSITRFVREGHGTPEPLHPTKTLVVSGPYRFVRNPMYLGVLLMIFGQAVFFANRHIAIYGLCAAAVMHLFVLSYEEPTLRARYGSQYDEYRRKVRRWIPRLTWQN
jgi:protein-S-isoprenylcysteine O-methyltransferase Ste14